MRLHETPLSLLAVLVLTLQSARATEPEPIVATASTDFFGYDGQWSAITVVVGTSNEQQWLSLLPATVNQEIWVVGSGGCDAGDTLCQQLRGGVFYPNRSSTFQDRGLYLLDQKPYLAPSDAGEYGLDTVALNDNVSIPDQVVGVLNTTSSWLGQIGLNVQQVRLNGSTNQLPYLSSLVSLNRIPSQSYGYTAGAYYRLKNVPASLVLGGYNSNRFTPNGYSFNLSSDYAPVIAVNSISLSSTGSSLLPSNWDANPVTLLDVSQADIFTIDSSTPFLWLPEAVCDNFERALNLTYNETLQLYFFNNDTSPGVLNNWGLNFTFTLSNLPKSDDNIQLNIPYEAFNLQLSFPYPQLDAVYGSTPTNYFPLRRASSKDEYIIGRAFLQETYLTVDYERGNFSLSQAVFTEDMVDNVALVAIPRPANSIFPGTSVGTSNSGLSTGAKAGIGVGVALVVVAAIALIWFFCSRRRRGAQEEPSKEKANRRSFFGRKRSESGSDNMASELIGDKRQPTEIPADSSHSRFELAGNAPIEMAAGEVAPTFFADRIGQQGTMTQRNDPRQPAEMEQRRGSVTKEVEAQGNSERSASPAPPYSPASLDNRFSSSISPYSVRNSQTFGTMSSGEQGISPVENSPGIHSQGSSQYSKPLSSPISPEATMSRALAGIGTGSGGLPSPSSTDNTLLRPPAGPLALRTPETTSRPTQEGSSEPVSASSDTGRRFSFEEGSG